MTRAALTRLLIGALGDLDLAARVREVKVRHPCLPIRIVAIGKAAPAMAAGALARWGSAIEECVVVAPDGTPLTSLRAAARQARVTNLVVHRAAHPLPDARSVRAADACLRAMTSAAPRLFVVLISGGASALVCAPAGITLQRKRAITAALLASGCSVKELNAVRKHLSRIKGGGLLRAAGANPVLTLIASDVIGGTMADVGSGPSVADPSTVADARKVLRRFAPAYRDVTLVRTSSAPAAGVRIIASPEALAAAVARRLRDSGHAVRVLPPGRGDVSELAREYLALTASARRVAFVRAAEPSIILPARAGRGGRSTHLAALVGQGLSPSRRALFAAFASDGMDGPSGTGGAIVDEHFAGRAGATALEGALRRFSTGPLHQAAGTALPGIPTGHNLADIHVLLRC